MGQRNGFNTSAVLIDAAEFSVARMPNRMGKMTAAAMFASLVKKTATYTIIHAIVQPTIGRSASTMLEDPACAIAIPSVDCDTCPGPDALGRNLPSRSEAVTAPSALDMSDCRPQKMASRAQLPA